MAFLKDLALKVQSMSNSYHLHRTEKNPSVKRSECCCLIYRFAPEIFQPLHTGAFLH